MNQQPVRPVANTGAGPSQMDLLNNIFSTVGSGLGAGLTAYGQGQQNQKQMQNQAQQLKAGTAEGQLQSDRNYQLNQAEGANQADPIGTEQKYAQKQALLKTILGNARNFSVTPGDPAVAAAAGKMSGGLQLPQGGLDPSMLESLFGDNATQASIAQHEKNVGQINPNAPMFDLSTIYGNSGDGSQNAFQTDIQSSNKAVGDKQAADTARQRQIVQEAIDGIINNSKSSKHSGILGLLGSLGGSALSALPSLLAL